MNQTANDDDGASDAPFEWLTSFKSLRHLVLPSRIVFGSSRSDSNDCIDASYSHTSGRPDIQLNALHVGCGTSTVGESLLSLLERTRNHTLQYGNVVNVDNDENALDSMQRRWEKRKPQKVDGDNTNRTNKIGTMEWKCLDFKNDESCRSELDDVHQQLLRSNNETVADPPGGSFDLVLDKSTLDCLLCAETNVVAQFLYEVYRALRVPTSSERNPNIIDANQSVNATATPLSWGGVYILVTFHPVEFVERLLTQLPGADWHVEHEVIRREVEKLNENEAWVVDEVTRQSKKNGSTTSIKEDILSPSLSAWSSGEFQPDENYRKTITVFTCRRSCTQNPKDEASQLPTYILDKERVREHIERSCNEWYQKTNPMVTNKREEQLRTLFLKAAAAKRNINSDLGEDGEPVPTGAVFDLKQCYAILFTDAEREHLTYEYFLEDWDAYCERLGNDSTRGMTVAVAIDFLKEMQ